MIYKFDMIFPYQSDSKHGCRALYHFDMIFHLKAVQNFIAEHEERDFELIFQFKTAQNVVRRHYERDFDMIFHLKL